MTGTPQSLASPGWAYVNGSMVGQGANLSGVNLSNANLTDVNLTNANLTNANLSGTNLSGVVSSGIQGSPQLPGAYYICNGFLEGPNVSFVGANLTSCDFGGSAGYGRNFSGVSFVGVNLQSVHFDSAYMPNTYFDASTNLNGAYLENATLTSAVLSDHDLTLLGNLYNANLTGATLINDSIQGSSSLSSNVNLSLIHI